MSRNSCQKIKNPKTKEPSLQDGGYINKKKIKNRNLRKE